MKTKNLTTMALLAATALIFGYIESLLPPIGVPGIKLGLSNIVLLFAIYRLGILPAFLIMIAKVTVSSLLFSGMNVFFYSLAGGIFSILVMSVFHTGNFSEISVSILGGIFHNIGQLLIALIVLGDSVLFYLPVLFVSGAVMGFLTGIAAQKTLKHIPKRDTP